MSRLRAGIAAVLALLAAVVVLAAPSISSVILTSSSGTNGTNENLSVNFNATGANATDWRVN